MRAREFLKEDDLSVPQLKKEIRGQLTSINDFDILDRIYQVLSQKSVKGKIEKAFGRNTKKANVGADTTGIINDMITQIANLPGTTHQKREFVEALEKGKAVNVPKLLSKTASFSEIFFSEFAQNFFISIANYGRGSAMKGPGEFALAIMSPKISLAAKGDLEINGRLVEVKAAVNKSGGRLGETGHAAQKEAIINAIMTIGTKYAKTPEQQQALEKFSQRPSAGITVAVKTLHSIFPDNKNAVKMIVKGVVGLTFGAQIGTAVGNAAAKDPSGVMAEQEYMKQNFNWYKKKDGFTEILAIWFGGRKTFSFESGEELLQLRASGVFGAAGVSFIPSKPNETFAQINFTSKGR